MKKKVLLHIILLLFTGYGLFGQLTIDSVSVDSVSCFGYEDGAITAYVTGGSGHGFYYRLFDGPFIHTYYSPDSTYTFPNLLKPDFLYYFQVLDSNNLTRRAFSDDIFIGSPEAISISSASKTDIICATFNDGTISVLASGEHENLRYYLSGPETEDNLGGYFEFLQAGTYKVVVKDDDGCPSKDSVTNLIIVAPPLLQISNIDITPTKCYGGSDGEIEVTVIGGIKKASAPYYNYDWTGSGVVDGDSLQENLLAGTYSVEVTDDNGCVALSGDQVVGEADEITMTVDSFTNATCNGDNDGKVNISVNNGANPLGFYWEGINPLHTSIKRNADDLYADTYDLTITDNDGCIAYFDDTLTISEPDPMTVVIDNTDDPTCFGYSNGTIEVTINGGTKPYKETNWSESGTFVTGLEDPIGILPAGTYSLEVKDANDCVQDFTNIVILGQPDKLTATLTGFIDALCYGTSTGTAQVVVTKGTAPYTSYLWTGDGTGHTTTMPNPDTLKADTYDLLITDSQGCTLDTNNIVTIGQPDDIITAITVVDVDCNGFKTGEIHAVPDKGTSPYTLDWTGADVIDGLEDQTGLGAGFYSLNVTDAKGCEKDYINIEVIQNNLITATFDTTHLTCYNSADGAIDPDVSGGFGGYDYTWTSDLGYSSIVEDISGLVAANYTLTVKDGKLCEQTFTDLIVKQPDYLEATFYPTDIQCFDSINGAIAIDITGGKGPYQTDWTGPPAFLPSSDEDITGLVKGDYTLYLKDANGCDTTYTDGVTIIEPTEITISETHTDITCPTAADGTISVVAADGTPPGYTYQWSGPGGFNETTADITNLDQGQYDLSVTDSNLCPKDFINVATMIDPPAITVTFDSYDTLDCYGNNDASINITAGGTSPLSFLWTRSGGGFVSTDPSPSMLNADTYSLQITDGNGCSMSYPDTIEIIQPDEVMIALAKTDIDCYGDPTGVITVTTTGGIGPPYQYRQLGFAYQGSNVFPNLIAGTYTIFTKDANDCETSDVIAINQPGQITYSDYGVSGSNKCNGDADATIYINTVNGGVPPYQYTNNGGTTWQAANSFPNLPGGSYDVRVMDTNICERTINNNLLVDEPFPITISYYDTVSVTACFDTPEGKIEIMANGGSGTLKYSIDGGATQPTGLFTGLIGGSYDVQIVDDSLCTKDTIATIDRPSKVVFDKADTLGVTGCFGDSNGEIDANAIGGTGLKQYSLDAMTYQLSGQFTGLPACDTTVWAIDTKGCTADTTVTITQPAPITFIIESKTDVDCSGNSTGTVTAVASGGTLPYTYTLNPAALPANDSGKFVGVPAGAYTVDVNDAGGCGPFTSALLTVDEPAAVVIDSVVTDFISCNGANDAEIVVYVSGGTPPYTYSYDNEATYISASSQTSLGPGTYDVFVQDANGCPQVVGSYTFVDPPIISLSASLTHVSPCFGGTNGAIAASAAGGWESFEYSINGADYFASGDFSGLADGDYTIFTRDTGTCSSTINVSITEPAEVTATVTKTDYVDAVRGTITITDAAGGVPPYEYAIDGLAGTFTSTTSYIDLVQGSYDVVVRDDSGCNYVETVQIDSILPLLMLIDSADVSCNGADDGFIEFLPQDAVGEVQYSIDDGATYVTTPRFDNLVGNTMYILRAFDEDDKVYWDSVFITQPDPLVVTVSLLVAANCNVFSETGSVSITVSGGTAPYTYLWSNGSTSPDLVNIVAGDYNVGVTDKNSCVITENVFIPALVIVNADAGKDTTICQGETIVLNAKAGDVVLWDPATYLSNQGIADPIANNVQEAITYTFTETESSSPYGCYDIDSLTINILPTFGITATEDTVALMGQLIQLETSGGPFDSYSWIPSTGLDDSEVSDPVATAQNSITYYINATNEYGCVETDSVHIEVIEDITVYNAFSPNNGDDINQYFEIENASQFPGMVVEVYNRWGSRVFSSVGYSDDKRWDGTARGKDVPIGTYYYIIIPYPDASPITGNVTIIR